MGSARFPCGSCRYSVSTLNCICVRSRHCTADWQASIFTSAGAGGEPRIFFLQLHCDKDYPKTAPTIRFTSRINLECVDASGRVGLPWLC